MQGRGLRPVCSVLLGSVAAAGHRVAVRFERWRGRQRDHRGGGSAGDLHGSAVQFQRHAVAVHVWNPSSNCRLTRSGGRGSAGDRTERRGPRRWHSVADAHAHAPFSRASQPGFPWWRQAQTSVSVCVCVCVLMEYTIAPATSAHPLPHCLSLPVHRHSLPFVCTSGSCTSGRVDVLAASGRTVLLLLTARRHRQLTCR